MTSVLARLASPRLRQRPPATVVVREAEVSECERYRWTLTREMRDTCVAGNTVLPWVMLNPSTADARRDDPTLCRIMGFTWRWGFDACLVVNLFPLRASDPRPLATWLRDPGLDPLLENVERAARALAPFDAAMAAWGAPGPGLAPAMHEAVAALLEAADADRAHPLPLFALGRTRTGHPTHPMARGTHRLPDDTLPRLLSREALVRRIAA